MTSTHTDAAPTGAVLFADDGSELAKLAIEEAGRQLAPGRDALVLCVWQPSDVGFVPIREQHFDAAAAGDVQQAAEETAAYGASLAENAGFRPQSMAIQAAPTWKGIVEVAEKNGVTLIVLGSHRRGGLAGHLLGSVTAAVAAHSASAVLIVQQPSRRLAAYAATRAFPSPPHCRNQHRGRSEANRPLNHHPRPLRPAPPDGDETKAVQLPKPGSTRQPFPAHHS